MFMEKSSIAKRKFIIKSPKYSPTNTKHSSELFSFQSNSHFINTIIQPQNQIQPNLNPNYPINSLKTSTQSYVHTILPTQTKILLLVHSILAEIYLKKYDIEKNDDHINSLVANIVSQLALNNQSRFESPDQISMVEQISKEYHLRQIKRFKGIARYLEITNSKIKEEKKQVKTQLAKKFLKTWYENLVCHVIFPKGKLFQHAQHEAAQYQSNHELFIQETENLVLLNQFLKDTLNQQRVKVQLDEASKSSSWTQEMMKRYEDFLIVLKKSHKKNHKKNEKGRFAIMFMQFLVDDFEKEGNDKEIQGKSLLQIFTSMNEKWLCSSKNKEEKSNEMELQKQGTTNSQKGQRNALLQTNESKQIQKKGDGLNKIRTKESLEMGQAEKMVEEKTVQDLGKCESKMVDQ